MRATVLLLAAAAIARTAPAHAAEQSVELRNRASRAVDAVAIKTGDAAWSANLLRQDTLPPGQTVTLRFDSDQRTCTWDIRLTLVGGAQVNQPGIDLCKATQIEFYEDGADVAKLRVH